MAQNTNASPTLEELVARLERTVSAGSLAGARGQGNMQARLTGKADKIRSKIEALGGVFDEAGNPQGADYNPTDFSNGTFALSSANALRGEFQREGRKPRPSSFGYRNEQVLAERTQQQSQQFYDTKIAPIFESLSGQINDLLSQDTLSASELADMRGNIATTVKTAEESRLRRVAQVLGTRGLDPGSPAGAALANRVANESDQLIVEQLRNLGLDAEKINQADRLMEIQLAEQTALAQINARAAALSGDQDRLFAINEQIGSLMEAIRQQREAVELQKRLADDQAHLAKVGMAVDVFSGLISGGSKVAAASAGTSSGASNG